MFIDLFDNNGIPYLRLVESRRTTTKNGKITSVKFPVFHIGPLSRYDDGLPDYMSRLRQSFRDGEPLIESLRPYIGQTHRDVTLTFRTGTDDCIGRPKLFADAILSAVFKELGLSSLMASIKTRSKIEFDLANLVRLVVFGRILRPGSKAAAVRQNSDYQTPLLAPGFNSDHVYDMLDVVYNNRYRIYRTLNKSITKGIGRGTSVIFYDVTNFYFETEEPDQDEEGADGRLVKGLRKLGVSKENRKQPIVQLGLFMDRNGIPIGVEEFPGNTLDHLTMQSAVKNIVHEMHYGRFIFVADRGLCNHKNNLSLVKKGDGYLVSKSIKKTAENERRWILDQTGYTAYETGESLKFKCKSHIVKRTLKDDEGVTHSFFEKVLVYWSERYYRKERAENESFLAFLHKLEESPSNFRITAAQSRTMKKFMKKDVLNHKTGEVLESSQLLPLVDWDKVREWKEFMGYYQIVTSEVDMPDNEIISIYHELSQIEDRFRVMKGSLETRPIFCRTPAHISAHLVLCAVALVMLCLIQKKIRDSGLVEKLPDQMWFSGLSGDRLQAALCRLKTESLPRDYYRFCDIDDQDLNLVLASFGIRLKHKLYTAGDLSLLRRSFKLFDHYIPT